MLAVRLGHDQNRHSAMLLRIQSLHPRRGVAGVACSVKDGMRIVFLRLMLKHQNNLSLCVQALVIVIVELGRCNPVSGKDNWRRDLNIVVEATQHIRRLPLLFVPTAL